MRRNRPSTTIIGIDLSLTGTGICCSKPLPLPYMDSIQNGYSLREINPKSKGKFTRWCLIRRIIRQVITQVQSPLVFIEGYAFGAPHNMAGLGEIGGIIRIDLHDHNIQFVDIPPTTLKKFVSGKGNVKKDVILKEVYRRWGMDLNSHNLADAFGLMMLGKAVMGYEEGLTKPQIEVAMRIRKDPNILIDWPKC